MEENTSQEVLISSVNNSNNSDDNKCSKENDKPFIECQNSDEESVNNSQCTQDISKVNEIVSDNSENLYSMEVEQTCSHQEDNQGKQQSKKESTEEFKKPILFVGKRGKIAKIRPLSNSSTSTSVTPVECEHIESDDITQDITKDEEPAKLLEETELKCSVESLKVIALPYTEPSWSGKPEKNYNLEVLKSGVILQNINLSNKSFHVVGRLPSCDISLAHPTISRFHAILQYRAVEGQDQKGLYLYDLGSTHGTFWNGNRIRSNVYVRLYDGHMIKFGCSQRKYILQAPSEDREEESEFSLTELKEKRNQGLQERKRIEIERCLQLEEEERLRKEEEDKEGIDWGMAEDAEEETDLQENPYAVTHDEELFLKDPKKTLRGWFEREGYELQYQTEERGFGQFLCWVDLPIEDVAGRSVRAEAIVKGKKKESVIQCAIEACKILDKYNLLRQANPEGRKRKVRNWEEDDYYSSDEDNFLDRTGTIEKKREQRMRQAGKIAENVETYDSLVAKHKAIVKQIAELEERIRNSQRLENASKSSENGDEDALDVFMSTLNKPILSKSDKLKMKVDLQNLRKEESNIVKLVNLTKPANLPPLVLHTTPTEDIQRPKKLVENKLNVGQRKKHRIINDKLNTTNSINTFKSSQASEEETGEEIEDATEIKAKHKTLHNLVQNKSDIAAKTTLKDSIVEDDTSIMYNEDQSRTENIEENENITEITIKKAKEKMNKAKTVYEEDVYSENYSTWVPPQDQIGDGKTSLNAKYGY